METKFLEMYLLVVGTGSIASASRALNIAPTTISQQIRALEKEFGCALLQRSGQTVRPTEAGYRILNDAHFIIQEIKDIQNKALSSDLPSGPLRLGAIQLALSGTLINSLHAWNKDFPNIHLFIQSGDSIPLLKAVSESSLDAAIIVKPLFKLPKSCDWIELSQERLVLVVNKFKKIYDPLEMLKKEPFIQFDRNYLVGKLVDQFLNENKIIPESKFELDGTDIIAKFISEDLGISILPLSKSITDNINLRYIELPKPAPIREIILIWNRSSAQLTLSLAFKDILIRTF